MPVTLEIASALDADAQIIAEMSRRLVEVGLPWTWTPARVARHIHHPDSMVVTARTVSGTSPAIAAFAIMHFGDDIAHLNLLAVDSRWQRRGLGRRLVQWLEMSAITAGTFTLCLEVRARNPVALLFYRELGFDEAGRVPRYYSGREDAIRLTKDLRHPLSPGWPAAPRADAGEDRGAGPTLSAADWVATHIKKQVPRV
ncbi:MAG: GNAT family N-acetyltransferase [Gammaproteobacteria bacterium]|nr:GNAT family N-acetyltransferase [Gammaproteobacteria bacterium]MDH5277183.1 GNAT family N-acetyltransferase [Gammaproteobacteria bacterium]